MIRTVPLTAVQMAVYEVLTANLTGYPIFDDSTPLIKDQLPRGNSVIIGEISAMPEGAKAHTALWNATVSLEIYSDYKGKKMVNEIADELVTVLTATAEVETLRVEGYKLIMLKIESVEVHAEDWNDGEVWQHGLVRVLLKLEQQKT